jgi:RNA polymerase sigma-70 factor (ECF subfamily)
MENNGSDFTELIGRARRGDRDAADFVLGAHRKRLVKLAQFWLGGSPQSKVDASDFVQLTLLRAYRHLNHFRGEDEPELTAWLRRILARTIIDETRRRNRSKRKPRRQRRTPAGSLDQLLADSGTTPSQVWERCELEAVLADALAKLSPEYREVLVLRSLRGYEWSEVAKEMNRSKDAARMLWTRALKAMRPHIQVLT